MKTPLIKFFITFVWVVFAQLSAQVYNYTWMKGSPSASLSVYGTMGVASATSNPGSQSNGITWTDQSGNLWLFGGQGWTSSAYGILSDLWKYSPITNDWTWVSGSGQATQTPVYGSLGVPSSSNTPGGRYGSASWSDGSGNLWLFGGMGSSGPHNDLWRYNVSTNQWTWMGGANTPSQTAVYGTISVPSTTNIPGASFHFTSWKDAAGNFWLYDGLDGNEVWKYNPSTAQWAWMSGTNTGTVLPVYGTLGVSSSSVHPGERWTEGVSDASGNLYVFGGKVATATGFGRGNDLWRYDISNNQWTWIAGTQSTSHIGVYGTQGVFSASAVPAARYGHVLWFDGTGKIWLFGGEWISLTGIYWLNDTWCFDITAGQWAWMKGDNTPFTFSSSGTGAVYGTQTIPSVSNTPGWRSTATYWPNDPNSLWIFSGIEWTSSTELWRFNSCTSSPTLSINSSHSSLCAGSTATLTASGSATSYSWNTGAQTNTISVSPSITTVYYVVNSGSSCATTAQFTLPVQSLSITLQNPANPMCSGRSYILSASSANSYSWSTGHNSQTVIVTPAATTMYSLSAPGNNCIMTATYALNIVQSPTIAVLSSTNPICSGQSVSLTASGASTYTWNAAHTGSVFIVAPLTTTSYSIDGAANGCTASAVHMQIVIPNPVVSISSSTPVTCSGQSVSLTASGASTYTWNAAHTGSVFIVAPLTTTSYSIDGAANGCTASAVHMQIVIPHPVVSISSSTPVTCSGHPAVLTASGATTYSWSTGQTLGSFSISPMVTTIYTVTGFTNGCGSTETFTQHVLPSPVLSTTGPVSSICAGETAELIVSGASSYTWSIQGLNNDTIQVNPIVTTSYMVTGTAGNGCQSTATLTLYTLDCVGAKEIDEEGNNLTVYPNPASHVISIKGVSGKTLKVINSVGQTILEQRLESNISIIHVDLPLGIYYCMINGMEKIVKLIIE